MKKMLFLGCFCGILSIQIVSVISVALIFDRLLIEQSFGRLKQTLKSINIADIAQILSDKSDNRILTTYRVSIFNTYGDVLYDNKADIRTMDNHVNRTEIVELLLLSQTSHKSQSDRVILTHRYSHTLQEQMLYAARLMQIDADIFIVRVAESKRTWQGFLMDLLPYMCALLSFTLILSIILAFLLTRKIIAPIEAIDLSRPIKSNPYKELAVFMQRIAKQKKKIKKQIVLIKARSKEMDMIINNMKEGFVLLSNDGMMNMYNEMGLKYLDIKADDKPLEMSHLSALKVILDGFICEGKTGDYHFEIQIGQIVLQIIALVLWRKNTFEAIALIMLDKSAQKQAEAMRKAFSANVSHELKTPLSIILASSEMLKNHLVKKADEELFLDRIYTESKRLSQLIDDILRLSFFDEYKEHFEKDKTFVNIYAIIQHVCANLRTFAAQKDIALHIESTTNAAHFGIFGISALLEDMIYNLVENAIKYSHSGKNVWLYVQEIDSRVRLSVRDEGIGIAKCEQERIFERFYCVDKSRAKAFGGSGLGLAIVKHIVQIHNAQIHIESELGQGTCISIDFEIKH